MKVKIRNRVYDSRDMPIMLMLSDKEKKLIGEMSTGDHKFCSFLNKLNIYNVKEFIELSKRPIKAERMDHMEKGMAFGSPREIKKRG